MHFWTPVLLHLLLDLDTYGGVEPMGVFPLFLKFFADIIDPKLSFIFCVLILCRLFPKCWPSANVTAIPSSALSLDRGNFSPISIIPILSKVYDKLVFHKQSIFYQKFFFCVCCIFGLLERSGMHGYTAKHISSPS